MRNSLGFVKRLLYQLKKDYGLSIDIYKTTSSETNLQTGKKTTSRSVTRIRKAIVLPSILARKFSYDLSFIAANKNFTYGGFYDVTTRLIIVDRSDLPSNFELGNEDYIVYDRKRFDVKQFESLEHRQGYLITVKETVGQKAHQILSYAVGNNFFAEQRALGVK